MGQQWQCPPAPGLTPLPHPSNIPNRSTFACPYCGARNLDQQELVKHCVESHRSDPNRVVSARSNPSCVLRAACLGPLGTAPGGHSAAAGLLRAQCTPLESLEGCMCEWSPAMPQAGEAHTLRRARAH